MLLHGFPQFWWTWRSQMNALADLGFQVAAMDLRGYGGSDHPPHGYDPITMADDVIGVIRGLGASTATIAGHGWGGVVAWTIGARAPQLTDGLIAINAPHPRRLRSALLGNQRQRKAMNYIWSLQAPLWPERTLRSADASRIEQYLRDWSHSQDWLTSDVVQTYREAFLRWPTAHTAIESHRWAVRSTYRTDGRRYMSVMGTPITSDVLHIYGTRNPLILESTVDGCESFVQGDYQRVNVPTGHFAHEENPEQLNTELSTWLTSR